MQKRNNWATSSKVIRRAIPAFIAAGLGLTLGMQPALPVTAYAEDAIADEAAKTEHAAEMRNYCGIVVETYQLTVQEDGEHFQIESFEAPEFDGHAPAYYIVYPQEDPECDQFGTTIVTTEEIAEGTALLPFGNYIGYTQRKTIYSIVLQPVYVCPHYNLTDSTDSMKVYIDSQNGSTGYEDNLNVASTQAWDDPKNQVDTTTTLTCKNFGTVDYGTFKSEVVGIMVDSTSIPMLTDDQSVYIQGYDVTGFHTEHYSTDNLDVTPYVQDGFALVGIPKDVPLVFGIDTGMQLAAMNDDGTFDYLYTNNYTVSTTMLPADNPGFAIYHVTATFEVPAGKKVFALADDIGNNDKFIFSRESRFDISSSITPGTTPSDLNWIEATPNEDGTYTIDFATYRAWETHDNGESTGGADLKTPEGYASICANMSGSAFVEPWLSAVIRLVDETEEPAPDPDPEPTPDPNPEPTPEPDPVEDVEVPTTEGGSVSVEPVPVGDTTAIVTEPEPGQEVREVIVTDSEGNRVETTTDEDGNVTFEMPEGGVTVEVVFGCDGGDLCTTHQFPDIDQDEWYHDSVDWAIGNGVFHGYDNGDFGPNDILTREQAAAVLYNYLGGEPGASDSGLSDVSDDWYTDAVNWAVANGIMTGYEGTGSFGVGDALSREQFCAVVAKAMAADLSDVDLSVLDDFADAESVSEWARPAVAWAVQKGVVNGVENPDGTRSLQGVREITRSEMAAMMENAVNAGVLAQ
ncbi:S-layer homology domain-containing protein [Collinsella tanakaei]|nr:S-layer homology domain-containing protein [Collinsella tanakaei]